MWVVMEIKNPFLFILTLVVLLGCFVVDQDDLPDLRSVQLFLVLVRKASLCSLCGGVSAKCVCVFVMEYTTLR